MGGWNRSHIDNCNLGRHCVEFGVRNYTSQDGGCFRESEVVLYLEGV